MPRPAMATATSNPRASERIMGEPFLSFLGRELQRRDSRAAWQVDIRTRYTSSRVVRTSVRLSRLPVEPAQPLAEIVPGAFPRNLLRYPAPDEKNPRRLLLSFRIELLEICNILLFELDLGEATAQDARGTTDVQRRLVERGSGDQVRVQEGGLVLEEEERIHVSIVARRKHPLRAPRFETGDPRYAWLNAVVAVAEGRVLPNAVEYRVFQVSNG